jgi:5-methylthioadenosine/S-adenosylhomocysteine deaminase
MRLSFSLLLFVITAALRAETVDAIWSARWVVTMDREFRVIENGSVAVRADSIIAVGPTTEIQRKYQAKQRIQAAEGVLIPGLINTHTHAAMSLFRGIADDRRLQDWLENFIFPAEAKNVSADFVRWGTRLACLEMMLSGTTTFVDMYYFEDVVAEATKEAGMRGVLGETLIGFPVADYKTPEAALAGSEKFLARFKDDPLIVPALAPHALYTNSDSTLKSARTMANKYGVPLLIHLSETKRENDEAVEKRGKSPTQILDSLGVLNGRTVGAHGVWLDDADIATLKARGTGIAHCPSSNMKLASGVAPVVKLLDAGVPVGLGTDGVAGSNNDHFLMEEMDLAAKLQKVNLLDPQALPARRALEMATILGARALGMESQIGSIEAGKKADLVMLDTSAAHATPMYDVYSQVVYALKSSDVLHVMVNGRTIVRGRQSLTLNPPAILAKAREYQLRIVESLKPAAK